MKQTSVRGATKLSGRNVKLENFGKALMTGASDRRKTDGRGFVVDSLDGLDASEVHAEVGKHCQVLMT